MQKACLSEIEMVPGVQFRASLYDSSLAFYNILLALCHE